MHNILLIDNGDSSVHKYKKSLNTKGFLLINEQALAKAIKHISNSAIDLIVIDNSFAKRIGKSKKFPQLTNNIPKLILADRNNARDNSLWIKDSSAYPVDSRITLREFNSWLSKVTKNKTVEHDNRLLRTELDLKEKELDFFDKITKVFNSTSDMETSLDAIMNKAADMTGARAWLILLNDGTLLEVDPVRTSKKIRRLTSDKRTSLAGWVMKNSAPLIVQNVLKDKRYNKKVDKHPNIKLISLMCAPLIINHQVIGVVEMINKKRGSVFNDVDLNILANVSHYAAMTIKRAVLYHRIEKISITDDLTSLYNLSYLDKALDIELERAKRYRSIFSLIFMDIDYFKNVNDRHGHLVGSKVLIELAQLLRKSLRKIDVVSRYGGDEFVILLPQTSRGSSFMVAERLRKTIERNVFFEEEGLSIRLTASFGVASYPDDARNKEDLLKLADRAMYHGKFSTKNVVFAAS